MIPKRCTFESFDKNGNPNIQLIRPNGMLKHAAEISPEIKHWISVLRPDPAFVYVLITALGAGEYWGPNANGDFWPEAGLLQEGKYGYRTLLNANIYRFHKNKDVTHSLGKPIFVHYNHKMHRVELVAQISRQRAREEGAYELLSKLDNDILTTWSIGCHVPKDICSICGNEAKTRMDYCVHLKLDMNKIYPDGRQVYAINDYPEFFDFSEVSVRADIVAVSMQKVASIQINAICRTCSITNGESCLGMAKQASCIKRFPFSSELAEIFPIQKVAESLELPADIIPKIPDAEPDAGIIKREIAPGINLLTMTEPDLDEGILKNHIHSLAATTAPLGIVLKPQEFQHSALNSLGMGNLADTLRSMNTTFRPVNSVTPFPLDIGNIDETLKSMLFSYMDKRSAFHPLITRRVMHTSNTESARQPKKVANAMLDKISSLYNGYRESLVKSLPDFIRTVTINELEAVRNIFGPDVGIENIEKTSAVSPRELLLLGSMYPLMYLYSSYLKGQEEEGIPLGLLERFAAAHPIITGSTAAGLLKYIAGL